MIAQINFQIFVLSISFAAKQKQYILFAQDIHFAHDEHANFTIVC
jgi:hypothetical protein